MSVSSFVLCIVNNKSAAATHGAEAADVGRDRATAGGVDCCTEVVLDAALDVARARALTPPNSAHPKSSKQIDKIYKTQIN